MIIKIKICTLKPFVPTFPPTPPRRQETIKRIKRIKNKRLGTIKINESQIIYLQIVRTVCRACCQMIVACLEEYPTREEDRISEMQLTLNLIDKHRGL